MEVWSTSIKRRHPGYSVTTLSMLINLQRYVELWCLRVKVLKVWSSENARDRGRGRTRSESDCGYGNRTL